MRRERISHVARRAPAASELRSEVEDLRALVSSLSAQISQRDQQLEQIDKALVHGPIVLALCDRQLRYTWASGALDGLDAASMIGKSDDEVLGEPGALAVAQLKREVLDDCQAKTRNIHFVVGARSQIYRVTVDPLLDAEQCAIGICVVFVDVTESHLREAEREDQLTREHTFRLRAELESAQIRSMLQSVPSGILAWSNRLEHCISNPQLVSMLGTPMVPTSPYLDELCGPDLQPLAAAAHPVRRALAGETVRDEELVLLRRDGTSIPVLASASPIRPAGGAVEGVVLALHDISERKQLERLQREYVGLVSHDLRAPLGVIRMSAEILLTELEGMDDNLRFVVRKLDNGVRAMRELVDDLLEVAQLEAGILVMHTAPEDPAKLVEQTLDSALRPEELDRVHFERPSAPLVAFVEASRFKRVIANLVKNALKFSPADQQIEIEIRAGQHEVELLVRDHGPGMSEQQLARLFDRFGASDASRQHGGVGLGLYITRLIAEAHGGRCWAESTLSQGATFHVVVRGGVDSSDLQQDPLRQVG